MAKLIKKAADMDKDYNSTTWGCNHSRSKTGAYHNIKGFTSHESEAGSPSRGKKNRSGIKKFSPNGMRIVEVETMSPRDELLIQRSNNLLR